VAINDTLATDITTLAVRVAQFSKGEAKKILGNLEELGRDLERQIRDADFENKTARQQQRLKSLSRDVNESIRLAYFGDGGNAEDLQGTLSEVGTFTQAGAVRAIDKSIGGSVTRIGLNPTEMRVLTRDPVVLGNTTTEHWAKQSLNTQQAFIREMRLGISQGETNDQLVNRVRGTKVKGQTEVVEIDGKKKKVPVREGGVLQNVSRREAEALVRSSTQSVSNTTLEETYKANTDIIKGVAVLVTLDGSTTKICISLSGGIWNIVTGDPLPDSVVQEPYPGAPPYHWSCRTIIAPVTRSWDELARGSKARVTGAVTNPARTRASMDGEVPGKMTYDGFLRQKEKAGPKFANSVLGKGRADLWRQGKIQLNQLTDSNLRELSLAELRALAD
jgi:hypothetical protein